MQYGGIFLAVSGISIFSAAPTLAARPFLTQSDSAGRIRPFSTGLFFDWILLVLLIVNRVDFIIFVLFLEAVGVREY